MDEALEQDALGTLDIAVLLTYFTLLGAIALYVSRPGARGGEGGGDGSQKSTSESSAYFLAEGSASWWAVAMSLFASNIGSEHFVGLAGSSARSGVAVGWYEVGAIPVVIFTGLFFLPTYLNAAVQTTPDYLQVRYSQYCRTLVVCVSLGVYVFSKISATLFAGQIILVELIKIDKFVAVVLLVSCTALYTLIGGLQAVIYTEVLQTSVLLVGGIIVTTLSLQAVGGWSELTQEIASMNSTSSDYMHFFRDNEDEEYPWTGFAFGFVTIAPWYWGIDQVIVQRALAAKNLAHGQLGCSTAAGLKLLPFLMMVVPGMCGRVLLSQTLTPEEAEAFDFDHIYPWLVLNIIPKNLRGIIIASMLSSLMSALASVFNSSSTLFALNIWKQQFPQASETSLIRVGRVTVVVLAIISLCWLPIMPYLGNSLFLITQKPPAYVAPPMLSVYFWGMISSLPSRRACEQTLTFGIGLGTVRFIVEVIDAVLGYNSFGLFSSLNFLHFAAVSFWTSTTLLFSLSYIYKRSGTAFLAVGETDGEDRLRTLMFRFSLFEELMNTSDTSASRKIEHTSAAYHGVELVRTPSDMSGTDKGNLSAGIKEETTTTINLEEFSLEDLEEVGNDEAEVDSNHPAGTKSPENPMFLHKPSSLVRPFWQEQRFILQFTTGIMLIWAIQVAIFF